MLKKGFTMVEILIVIAIIGLLSVSLIPNLSGAPAKARDVAKKKVVTQTIAAIESYRINNGVLPVFNQATDANGTCLNQAPDAIVSEVFETSIPKANSFDSNADCLDGSDIYPMYTSDGQTFTVSISVESKSNGNNQDNTKYQLSN